MKSMEIEMGRGAGNGNGGSGNALKTSKHGWPAAV